MAKAGLEPGLLEGIKWKDKDMPLDPGIPWFVSWLDTFYLCDHGQII